MHKTFTYNGVSSADFGIIIGTDPKIKIPSRKFAVANVAGRNGNLYDMQDAWDEVTQEYYVLAGTQMTETSSELFGRIAEWLNSADGYVELRDDYDPDHYRLAVCVDATEVVTGLQKFGKATIRFRCRPERFLISQQVTLGRTDWTQIVQNTGSAVPVFEGLRFDSWNVELKKGECAKWLANATCANFVTLTADVPYYSDSDLETAVGTLTSGSTYSAYDASHSNCYGILIDGTMYYISKSNTTATTRMLYKIQTYDGVTGYVHRMTQINVTNGIELLNPTNHTAKPFIYFTPTFEGDGWQINDVKLTFTSDDSSDFVPMVIDCESENVTKLSSGASCNNYISITGVDGNPSAKFLSLKKGMNVLIPEGTDSITIDTRFWEI